MLRAHHLQVPGNPPQITQGAPGAVDRRINLPQVAVDAVAAVLGELPDLLHPRSNLCRSRCAGLSHLLKKWQSLFLTIANLLCFYKKNYTTIKT